MAVNNTVLLTLDRERSCNVDGECRTAGYRMLI